MKQFNQRLCCVVSIAVSDPCVTLKVLKKSGHKPSGWPPANRLTRDGGPGGRAARCAIHREGVKGANVSTREPEDRFLFDLSGIDWDSEADIENAARTIWTIATTKGETPA